MSAKVKWSAETVFVTDADGKYLCCCNSIEKAQRITDALNFIGDRVQTAMVRFDDERLRELVEAILEDIAPARVTDAAALQKAWLERCVEDVEDDVSDSFWESLKASFQTWFEAQNTQGETGQ